MPRIRFSTDPKLPADLRHLGYRKGVEVELSADQCERWIRRGCAAYITARAVRPAPLLAFEGSAGEKVSPSSGIDDDAGPAVEFDPATADIEAVRAFLERNGRAVHPRTGEARLRELAAQIKLAKESGGTGST